MQRRASAMRLRLCFDASLRFACPAKCMYYVPRELLDGKLKRKKKKKDKKKDKKREKACSVADLAAALCRDFSLEPSGATTKRPSAVDWLQLSLDGVDGFPLPHDQPIEVVRDDDVITLSALSENLRKQQKLLNPTLEEKTPQKREGKSKKAPKKKQISMTTAALQATGLEKGERQRKLLNTDVEENILQRKGKTKKAPKKKKRKREEKEEAPQPVPSKPAHERTKPPLTPDEVQFFMKNGYILLKNAFPKSVAATVRKLIWKRLEQDGITRDDPTSWKLRHGIAEVYGHKRGEPWTCALSPRLHAAYDQLLGAGRWQRHGCGWWVITFPGVSKAPWGVEGHWHVDGAHFRHQAHSKEQGILPIFLFNDIEKGDGGTALLQGSHMEIAKMLLRRRVVIDSDNDDDKSDNNSSSSSSNTRKKKRKRMGGMDHRSLVNMAQALALAHLGSGSGSGGGSGGGGGGSGSSGSGSSSSSSSEGSSSDTGKPSTSLKVVEVQGKAGDVMLCHPFLVHARSKNLSTRQPPHRGVRIMCNPTVALKEDMQLVRLDPRDHSPLERTVVAAWRNLGSESSALRRAGRRNAGNKSGNEAEKEKGKGRAQGKSKHIVLDAEEEKEAEAEAASGSGSMSGSGEGAAGAGAGGEWEADDWNGGESGGRWGGGRDSEGHWNEWEDTPTPSREDAAGRSERKKRKLLEKLDVDPEIARIMGFGQ